jgi:hypothetical protein
MARKSYRVLVGLNYPPNGKGVERRAEPGDLVGDLPPQSVPWLLEDGSIAEVDEDGEQS